MSPVRQKVLCNAGAHEVVLNILEQLPMHDKNSRVIKILETAYSFLRVVKFEFDFYSALPVL